MNLLIEAKYIVKFWQHVDQSGGPDSCWTWTGSIDSSGYGRIKIHPKWRSAHRVSYILAHGVIPDSTVQVCHACDNRPCVNPSHLFLGSNRDNMWDARSKGRRGGLPIPIEYSSSTHCIHGHVMTPELTAPGGRCRQCMRAVCRESYRRRKARAAGMPFLKQEAQV